MNHKENQHNIGDVNGNFIEEGIKIIRFVLNTYVNIPGRFHRLQLYDFIEYLDEEASPYLTDGKILSDPGHALEFAGLAGSFLNHLGSDIPETGETGAVLCRLFLQNFRNGFNSQQGGIIKLFDLISRRPANKDMPWWSLPETIRAAWECLSLAQAMEGYAGGVKPGVGEGSLHHTDFLRIISSCWNSLIQHYIGNNPGDFCIQNRDEKGYISSTIPAVPDVDPLYHTGLPLLTVLRDL